MGLKEKVKGLLGETAYRKLLVATMRATGLYTEKFWLNPSVELAARMRDGAADEWFGYYDVAATSSDGKRQIVTRVPKGSDQALVCVRGLDGGSSVQLAATHAWNWQMGCRAQWWDGDSVLYNDYADGAYGCRIVGTDGAERGAFPFPVYTLSRDRRLSFYPDFEILGALRPGYGYRCSGAPFKDVYDSSQNGVYVSSFETGESGCLLSMAAIRALDGCPEAAPRTDYVNHVSASPFADMVMFFHLWKDEAGVLWNKVVVVDYEGNMLCVLEDFDRASHYAWRDERHLLLTVGVGNRFEYRLYDLRTGTYRLFPHLTVDGHPSYVAPGLFITDTYPDHFGMQHLLLCSERAVLAEIATVYHNPVKLDEHRCDLHPRYRDGLLSFDCVPGASREQCVLQLDVSPEGCARLEAATPGDSGFVGVYKRMAGNPEALPIKLAYNRLTNGSMKAHYYLWKMQHAKNRLSETRYFNLLETKYGVWISPQAEIGKRFRMVHSNGIAIGSKTIIGDDCTVYQQVTIGKGGEKFPVVGNGVTVYAGAKVIGGVAVGDGAVIGANSVVTHDVPAGAVVAGVPARVIGMEEPARRQTPLRGGGLDNLGSSLPFAKRRAA